MRDSSLSYMELNYKYIGIRVKEERLRQKMTQERLAELANLSMTHMSHIETGNTKLSLPALHKVSWALSVSMDSLLCDSTAQAKEIFQGELLRYAQDCDETEIRIITDTIKSLKDSLRKRILKNE